MKKFITLILAAVMVLSVAVIANAGSEKTFKLATDAALDYPTTQALSKFAELVDKKSEGRITIEIYPSSLLGDEVSYMEQLQIGTVDIAKLSIGTISGLYEDMQAFSLPFMFKNGDEMWKVLESPVGEKILNGLNDYGIQGIGFTDNGNRNFYTTKPIKTIEDFAGLTIRVQQNKMMIRMVESLGANAVNVAANEVYSALQTGVCSGGENNVNTILTDSYYEVAPYITLDSHTTGMDVICMNIDVWNELDEKDQAIIKEAMLEATAFDREIWNDSINKSIAELKDKGAVIYTPADEVLDSFKAAVQPLYEEYSDKLGVWIDEINAVLAE